MRVKLLNPDFEDFPTILGISYLFIYGEAKIKPQEEGGKVSSVFKENNNNNNDLITPIKTTTLLQKFEINSLNSNSNKRSIDKSDYSSSIEKMLHDRARSLVSDKSVKNIFKDRNQNLKEDK